MTPPRKGVWTSRDIAQVLYGPQFAGLSRFSSSNAAYREKETTKRIAPATAQRDLEDDSMMVDDEDAESTEEAPLNVLHDDVRVYFTRLLVELVGRVGGAEVRRSTGEALLMSRHAPVYMKKDYHTWGASECIEYLYGKARGLKTKMTAPMPEIFLTKRYSGRGARTGMEWSPSDWKVSLENLVRVGAEFGDSSLAESAQDLGPYLSQVLQTIRR
jgi:hypothetical protein